MPAARSGASSPNGWPDPLHLNVLRHDGERGLESPSAAVQMGRGHAYVKADGPGSKPLTCCAATRPVPLGT